MTQCSADDGAAPREVFNPSACVFARLWYLMLSEEIFGEVDDINLSNGIVNIENYYLIQISSVYFSAAAIIIR